MDVRVALEHQRIDAFELWCWRRLLWVPWTARKSNQSVIKEISPGCSLEGLMLKLKLQYFGNLMWRADFFEKTLMLGKSEGRRRRYDRWWDGWMASPTQWTWVWVDSGSWWWTGRPGMLRFTGLQRVGHDWATELNWTELHSNMCMSIPASQFTLPSFLPGNCKLIFYICDSRHLTFKMIIRFHISHTVFILSSVWTLPLCLWYWLQFGNQEGSRSVHGLLPGWSSWKVCWLFPEIPTFYPCDAQIVPFLYSGL